MQPVEHPLHASDPVYAISVELFDVNAPSHESLHVFEQLFLQASLQELAQISVQLVPHPSPQLFSQFVVHSPQQAIVHFA